MGSTSINISAVLLPKIIRYFMDKAQIVGKNCYCHRQFVSSKNNYLCFNKIFKENIRQFINENTIYGV